MATDAQAVDRGDIAPVLEFIRTERGFEFAAYKRTSLGRRFEKRMTELGISTYPEYLEHLRAHDDEFTALFDTVLINVTRFFRDPETWEYVRAEIVPRVLAARSDSQMIRVWSTGCSTGEEAYTLAMVFADALGDEDFRRRVKIYATDLDEHALSVGRHAAYAPKAMADVPEELRERYFEQSNGRYVFRNDLRRSVIFGRHDVINDPPISRVDLLAARNTLMYFNPDAQSRILGHFHFSLSDDGFLVLGKSEMLIARSNLFTPVDVKRRVFAKIPAARFRDRLLTMIQAEETRRVTREHDRSVAIHEAAFEAAPTAQIAIDNSGVLAAVNAQARHLFGLSRHDVGRPFQDLEVSYRPVELRSLIERLEAERHNVVVRELGWARDGTEHFFDVTVAALVGSEGRAGGVSVTYADVTRYRELHNRLAESTAHLETAYEELQSTAEELETTNEELQSTNEELETTNEELQSTNEELETMNEELQSTNEELETMNAELGQRGDDLDRVNLFLESILGSLDAGVIVLDRELRIRAWSAKATDMWGLRADEVEGEHLLNLDTGLPVAELAPHVRSVLSDGATPVRHTTRAVTRRGRAVETRVRVSPLLGGDGALSGAILVTETEAPS